MCLKNELYTMGPIYLVNIKALSKILQKYQDLVVSKTFSENIN